nr:mRNA-decapping enzyme 1A isoform X1 [Pelodiscus sinensis]|eukprot:XP_006129796.2 mRNA-decapping enzyme 1A isoform X1 [Pelodiscus sinensis]
MGLCSKCRQGTKGTNPPAAQLGAARCSGGLSLTYSPSGLRPGRRLSEGPGSPGTVPSWELRAGGNRLPDRYPGSRSQNPGRSGSRAERTARRPPCPGENTEGCTRDAVVLAPFPHPLRFLPGSKMESLSKAGQEMSLAVLKRNDPYITSIADVTGQVALYSFSPKANEWEKTDIEGTLFVYRRSASPYYGFTIVNRLNMHNLVEPVNKDLEFQLHEPFLLYRNASLSIYSIWFYDKNDCHRIAKLMAKVVQQEAQRSHQVSHDRESPSRTNGYSENKPIDILEMLSKAKDEYERTQINDLSIISSSGIQKNANPMKTESMETSEQTSSILQMQDQPFQSTHKHLTVEELFGTSFPKEQPAASYPSPDRVEKLQADTTGREHNLFLPFLLEQSSDTHQSLGKPESTNVKINGSTLNQQESVTPMLIAPASVLQPDVKNVSNYTVQLSPILNSASTTEAPSAQILSNLNSNMMQVMHQTTKQMSPIMNQSPSDVNHMPQNLLGGQNQLIAPLAVTNTGNASNTPFANVDLLQKLRLTPQQDQIQQSLSKTTMMPSSSSTISQLATPESFKESHTKPASLKSKIITPRQIIQQIREPEVFPQPKALPKANQVTPSQFVTATTTVTPSVLLSPSVFQQSAAKSTETENKASTSSPLTVGATEIQTMPPTVLSRSQLQETLIHLIKNDSSFLSTVHEVYLQVLTKNTDLKL